MKYETLNERPLNNTILGFGITLGLLLGTTGALLLSKTPFDTALQLYTMGGAECFGTFVSIPVGFGFAIGCLVQLIRHNKEAIIDRI